MLAKKTSRNQVTLPKKIVEELPETDYFDVTLRGGAVVLRPVTARNPVSRLAAVRRKIRSHGLTSRDITRAVEWARSRQRQRA